MRLTLLCLWIFYSASVFSLQVDLQARSAILINAESKAILFEKESKKLSYPASLTKIATSLFLLDGKKIDLNQQTKVTHTALNHLKADGSAMGLVSGEILNYDSLLHGLLLVSGNDAAQVLAESVCGSIPQFMDELNQYLQNLGCTQTHFCNPHGYHDAEHMTTAYDLSLIAQKALQIPQFQEIVKKRGYLKPKTNRQKEVELKQTNRLMLPGKHFYPKAIGVKTGYHSFAQYTLVAAAAHEGRTLIAVLLGCDKSEDRYRDAQKLFDAAFAEKKIERLLIPAYQVYQKSMEGANVDLEAIFYKDLTISYYPSEEPNVKAFIHWDDMQLPIQKGKRVGELRVCDDSGQILAKEILVARQDVKATFFHSIESKFNWFLNKIGF